MIPKTAATFFFIFLLAACGTPDEKTGKPGDTSAAGNDAASQAERDYYRHDTLLHPVDPPEVVYKYDTLSFRYDMDVLYDPDEFMSKLQRSYERKGKCITAEQKNDSVLCAAHYQNYRGAYRRMKDADTLLATYAFPEEARIVERCDLTSYVPDRAVVLWLKNPKVCAFPDEQYSCPTATSGNGFFQGLSYLSLLDTRGKRIINTVPLTFDDYTEADEKNRAYCDVEPLNAIPFSIGNAEKGFESPAYVPYHVSGGTRYEEGLAVLLFPDDYNGDGKKMEFAFYRQTSCASCRSTVFGYSIMQDRLLHYSVYLKNIETRIVSDSILQDVFYFEELRWIGPVFRQPMTNGHTREEADFRGRGGDYVITDVWFNSTLERFEGVRDTRDPDEK
ncbi:MAG: hypothetical protein FD123_1875 [Bacteroidetes bacterium]|nr:MAG: hypothetical protein FD123_1875 [Bacteroidota bacterium]